MTRPVAEAELTIAVTPKILKKVHKRVLFASLVGSGIEWFDYFLYAAVTGLVFDKLFFPTTDPLVGQMLAWLTFSLTFFIRPFGGVLFSHIGDKIGRKKTLVITLSLMGFATFCIGCLPGYATIGIWAPILLIVLRILQGMGVSGEWGGALLLAYEYAPASRKGLFGSVPQMGVPLGLVLAALAMSVVTLLPIDFESWGWRLPFWLSAFLVLLGLWIRKGIDETPEFVKTREKGEVAAVPLVETLRGHWREVLIATGGKVVETGPFYIFSVFSIGYVSRTLNMEKQTILNAVTLASVVTMMAIPFMGYLSDLIGRKRLFLIGTLLMAAVAVPYFMILDMGTPLAVIVATVLTLGLVWAPVTACLGTLMSEIFSTRVRYTGITLGYQIGAATAGGTAPLLATWLQRYYGNNWLPVALYIIVCAVISFVSVLFAKDTVKGS